MSDRPAPGARGAALAVGAAHLVLVAGLLWLTRHAELDVRHERAARPIATVALVEAPPPAPPAAAARPEAPPKPRVLRQDLRTPPPPLGQAIHEEAAPVPLPAPAPAPVASTPGRVADAASAPLRLELSREQLRAFRAAPPRPSEALQRVARTHGERVAAAIEAAVGGPPDLVLEPMADGGLRARAGGQCVLLSPSAMSRIDPIGHVNDPMLVRPCP